MLVWCIQHREAEDIIAHFVKQVIFVKIKLRSKLPKKMKRQNQRKDLKE